MVISSTFPVRLFTVIGRKTCFGVFIVQEWQNVSNPEKERGRGDGPPVRCLKLFQQNIRTLLIESMPSYCRADQVLSQSHTKSSDDGGHGIVGFMLVSNFCIVLAVWLT